MQYLLAYKSWNKSISNQGSQHDTLINYKSDLTKYCPFFYHKNNNKAIPKDVRGLYD